ncbi:alpha/beta fold hydrolase [Patescibacteria group bacterium]|nr:alpha/beta fold hydrolase [Patescibacteria group bacterium]
MSSSLTEKNEKFKGYKYQYLDSITGEHIILAIHGLAGSKESMSELIETKDNFRYIFIDLPGHGNLETQGITCLLDFAKYIESFLTFKNISRIGIIGFSLGGLVALKTIQLIESSTQTYGIIWAAPLNLKHNFLRFNSKLSIWLTKILPMFVYRKLYKSFLPDLLLKTGAISLSKRENEALGQYDSKLINKAPTIFKEKTYTNVKSPLLYIFGTNDSLVKEKYLDELQLTNEHQKIEIIESGGHFPSREGLHSANLAMQKFFGSYL